MDQVNIASPFTSLREPDPHIFNQIKLENYFRTGGGSQTVRLAFEVDSSDNRKESIGQRNQDLHFDQPLFCGLNAKRKQYEGPERRRRSSSIENLMTTKNVAETIGKTTWVVCSLVRQGKLQAYDLGGDYRFTSQMVLRYLEMHRVR